MTSDTRPGSKAFKHLFTKSFFLSFPRVDVVQMNKAPKSPPTTPRMIAIGIITIALGYLTVISPNLI